MDRLESQVSTSDEGFRTNHARMSALVAELRERTAPRGKAAGRRRCSGTASRASCPRVSASRRLLDPDSPWLELSTLAAFGMYENGAPSAGIVTGIGRVSGREVLVVANDATVKGGTYYPVTVKKHLRAQQVAMENRAPLRVPRRLRRRVPAAAGGRLPRPRALRAHLLQPGAHVGRGHPADRRGHGVVHRRRRLRARDVRRDDHRARHGHDLPRRPAAGEGGDGRGSHGRGARRRRRAHAAVRGRRLLRRGRRARPAHGPHGRVHAARHQARCPPTSPRPKRRTTIRRNSTASSAPTCASPTTSAR